MATEGGDAATSAATDSDTGTPAPPATVTTTFSQDDVSRVASTEHAKGSREGRKALLEELGFDKFDDLKTLVSTHKEAQRAAMTEAERLKAEAADAKAAADAERTALASERHTLNVERALQAAGAQGDISRLVRLVDVEVGSDAAAVQAAVESIKADATFAALFRPATAPLASSEPTGGGAPSRPTHSPDALTRGEERAKARNPEARRSFLQ
jgi:hypothetical protein